MEDWVQNGLCRHIVVKDDALVTIWEGFVNKVTITGGPLSIVIGPLLDTANRCAVTYSELDGNVYSERKTTEVANDEVAQAKYGIIEQSLSVSGANPSKADQIRDTFLAETAWPAITHDIAAVKHEPNIVVDCLGYSRWLERVIYGQTATTGDVYLEDKLKSVILAEPNGYFDIGVYSLLKELLLNTNFEEEGAGGADIWADWVESAGDGTLTRILTDHHEGASCVGMVAGATFNTLLYQDYTVVEGRAYRLTFWTRDLDQDVTTGVDDGGLLNQAYLTDTTEDFKEAGVKNGQILQNTTDVSEGPVTNVEVTKLHGTLVDGTDNDWDTGDGYSVVTGAYQGRYQIYDVTGAVDIVALKVTSEYGDTSWHKVTEIFYAPAGCTSVRIHLRCAATDTKQVYFDACSVKEYNAAMVAQTTLVPSYEDRERTAWSIIKELLGYGDWENKQYNWGVYADRRVKFEKIPDEFEYMMSALDVGSGYKTMEGGSVEDYNVLPGKWLLITDILTGVTASSLHRDPKAMFIEEVRYSAEQGLTVNPGKFGELNQQMAKLGLVGK